MTCRRRKCIQPIHQSSKFVTCVLQGLVTVSMPTEPTVCWCGTASAWLDVGHLTLRGLFKQHKQQTLPCKSTHDALAASLGIHTCAGTDLAAVCRPLQREAFQCSSNTIPCQQTTQNAAAASQCLACPPVLLLTSGLPGSSSLPLRAPALRSAAAASSGPLNSAASSGHSGTPAPPARPANGTAARAIPAHHSTHELRSCSKGVEDWTDTDRHQAKLP
jgi:hypothetical protein